MANRDERHAIFPVSSVESFYELQTATLPDAKTGKPNPEKVNAFVMSHPEIKPFCTGKAIHPLFKAGPAIALTA